MPESPQKFDLKTKSQSMFAQSDKKPYYATKNQLENKS